MSKCTKVCQSIRHDGSPCNRPLFDNHFCIFHSKEIERKRKEFGIAFWEEFNRQEEKDELLDFSYFIFPEIISFQKKVFDKPVYFKLTDFRNDVDFSYTEFQKDTFFEFTQFSRVANFSMSFFKGNTYFSRVEFFSAARFFNAQFTKSLQIRSSNFMKYADFKHAEFFDEAYFESPRFEGKTDFRNAIFYKDLRLLNASFSKEAYFWYTKFYSNVEIFNTNFMKSADFSEAEIFKNISLYGSHFEEITGLFELLIKKKKRFFIIKKTRDKVTDFRFTLGQKASKKYPLIDKRTRDAWFLADFKIQHPIIYFLWNLTSKCGQSLARWAIISLLIALLFGAIYADYPCPSWLQWMNLGNWMEKVNPIMAIDQTKAQGLGIIRKATWFTPYYFSIVTFTTLGFGDVTPVNLWGEIWLAIEVILGYIMLGGLISIFANKLARRS